MHPANVTTRQGSAAAIVPFYAAREHVQANIPEQRDSNSEPSYCFGPFQLFPRRRLLLRDGEPVEIGCKSFDILLVLAQSQGEVVDKRELLARVWSGVTVEEGALRVQMTSLRKALGDHWYIKTVAGRGYCLVSTAGLQETAGTATGAALHGEDASPLPLPLDRIVGRSDDVRKISALLEAKRFVTVLGAGGIGKTTTAISVGHDRRESFAGAVHLIDLGRITESALLPRALASVLGLPVQSSDPTPEVLEHLRDRRMLLIFDSCEHLIEQSAVLIERIFHAAPRVNILTTSRELLRVDGEHAYRLSGLACPSNEDAQSAERVLSFAAPRLFVDRVTASGNRFELTDADAAAVARICRKLDGIALAINVAAVRAQTFGLSEVAGSLESRCWLLWRGHRTALPRHQTVAATVDWSYGPLGEPERTVLRRLSIFDGLFSLDAARVVACHGLPDAPDNLLIIDKLVAKSLLSFESANGLAGYRLLSSTRAYAIGKLRELGEFDAIAARAREYRFA
jgi:predicted ATPase/DNA-binding winged helix-turn-helix (wHTH) protein